jgi:hypothetical protein
MRPCRCATYLACPASIQNLFVRGAPPPIPLLLALALTVFAPVVYAQGVSELRWGATLKAVRRLSPPI